MTSDFSNPSSRASVAAGRYVKELLALLGERDPFEVQGELVPWIRERISGLDEDELRRREAPGKWSVMEVIGHLADTELVYRYRMRMAVAQPGSPIPAYDQDRWVEGLGYNDADPEATIRELEELRSANLAWLRGLSDEEMGRIGVHEERGPESVEGILRLLAAHDLVHRRQIERILVSHSG